MNKTMKKLGLLVVTAIALAMGVNGANALQIGSKIVTADETVYDANGNTVTVDETNATSFVITVNGPFADAIVTAGTEFVTLNFNGQVFYGGITNNGTLTINSNGTMRGKLESTGTLRIYAGNYAYLKAGSSISVPNTSINGVGTVLAKGFNLEQAVNSQKFKAVDTNGYYVLAEADASYTALTTAITAADGYVGRENATPGTYTAASYKPFVAAYNEAKALATTEGTANVVPVSQQATITALANKLAVLNTQLAERANYSTLDSNVAYAKSYVAQKNAAGIIYTAASIKALNNAIAAANANRDLSDQAVVDGLNQALVVALNTLVEKANYSKINDLESVIDGLKAEQYTTETWTVLKYVQSIIERDLGNGNQDRVNYFYGQLLSAVRGLKRSANQTINNGGTTTNPGTTVNPGTTNNGGSTNVSGTVVNPNTNASGTTGVVDTGDNVATYAVMNIVSLIALAGCGLVLKKQN